MVRSTRRTPEDKARRRSQRLRNKVQKINLDSEDDVNSIDVGFEEINTPSSIEQERGVYEPTETTGIDDKDTDIHVDLLHDLDKDKYSDNVIDTESVQGSDSDGKDSVGDGGTELERGAQGVLSSEADSDGAPENISLAESKLVAMEMLKTEQDELKRVQVDVKEKRRKKHELYRKQKVLKRSKVISRFPAKALEEVSMQMAKEKAAKKATKKLKRKLDHKNEAGNQPLPSEAHVGPVKVVALNDSQDVMGGALTNDFRQEHFYGDRLKRLPALSIQAKKYRNVPAKNFIKAH